MFNLTKDGYEAQRIKNGVYIYHSPGCFTCEHHIDNFKKFMNDFFVISTMEEPSFFESDGINITPTTRVYKNNEMVYEKIGALYDVQYEELRKYL